jgi:hypothetical protein
MKFCIMAAAPTNPERLEIFGLKELEEYARHYSFHNPTFVGLQSNPPSYYSLPNERYHLSVDLLYH